MIAIDIRAGALGEAARRAGHIPAGAQIVGSVARDGESGHGALVLLASGRYTEINDGSMRALDQGEVIRQLARKEFARLGGLATKGLSTPRKAASSRANGKLGAHHICLR